MRYNDDKRFNKRRTYLKDGEMKTRILTALAFILCLATPHKGMTQDVLRYEPPKEQVQDIAFEMSQNKELTYRFAGDDEEGALKLFVKNAKTEMEAIDPTASRLNAIQPAAGVKVHFEF